MKKRRTRKQTTPEIDFLSTPRGKAVLKAASSPQANKQRAEMLRMLAEDPCFSAPDPIEYFLQQWYEINALGREMSEDEFWHLTPRQIHGLLLWLRKNTENKSKQNVEQTPISETGEAGVASTPLAARRRAFVDPLLAAKGWSDWEWMIYAQVDWKTVKRYLEGGKTYRDTRKKLAKPLEINPLTLP